MRVAICLLAALLIEGCAERMQKGKMDKPSTQTESQQAPVVAKEELKGFEPVKAMLSQTCAPCHNPGGKMYQQLPFDNPEVVRSHSAPILGRLNKPEQKEILEKWLNES